MGFFSPWFLAGLLAAGIPLYLHLLRQFNRNPQPFSSLLFFERRIQSATSKRRLRYLILLAMRLALVALLVLAFADPFVTRRSASLMRRHMAVIALDRSFSMRNGDRMSQAKTLAHLIVHALPSGERAQILAVDSHVESLTPLETDQSTLDAAINGVQATDEASSYGEFSRALRVLDQTSGMQLDVRFLTDAQQTSMPPSFNDLRLGPHTSFRLETVGQSKTGNWAVESVTAPAEVRDPSQARVVATITGWNTKPATRTVSLLLDGQVVSSKDVSVPDCGRAAVEFTGFPVSYGAHRGEVRISPHDDLPQDDSFRFSMGRSDARKVLFLYARGRNRDSFFYKAALESAPAAGLTVQAMPIEEARAVDFSKFAYIVLNDPGTIDSELESAICAYLTKGGGALIAVGPNTAQAGVVPVGRNVLHESGSAQGAAWIDEPKLDFGPVEFLSTPVIGPKKNSHLLAKFADGTPALLEEPDGEGHLLVFGSTLDNTSSDFPVHAAFVPFVLHTASYLAGDQSAASSYSVGAAIPLRRTTTQNTAADVVGPSGGQELSLRDATRAMDFRISRAGFYDVRRADGRRLLVAANPDRRESDLTTVPGETLALWQTTGKEDNQEGVATEDTQRFPLWRYLMLVALLAAVVESIYSTRYLRQERKTA